MRRNFKKLYKTEIENRECEKREKRKNISINCNKVVYLA